MCVQLQDTIAYCTGLPSLRARKEGCGKQQLVCYCTVRELEHLRRQPHTISLNAAIHARVSRDQQCDCWGSLNTALFFSLYLVSLRTTHIF
jgi:hypothetical protein